MPVLPSVQQLLQAVCPSEAEIAYKKAIEINPNYAKTHCNLGLLYANTDRPKEAETAYKKAIAIADTAKTVKEEQKLELIGELAYMYYDKDKYRNENYPRN